MSLPEFEAITAHLDGDEDIDTWRTVYEATRDTVQTEPGSLMPSAIGTLAWGALRDEEREQALLELFFVYGRQLERERLDEQRHDVLVSASLLDVMDEQALQGDVDRQPGRMVVVERARLARVLAEMERLQTQVATEDGTS